MVKYSIQNFDKDHMAKSIGVAYPISTKTSVLICNALRSKKLPAAKKILENVIALKKAIPYTKFNSDVGHKTGIGPGRFPLKASELILKLLEQAEANAQFKGLNTSNLIILHICANRSSEPWHFGRQRRRRMKRTNVEVVVQEKEQKEAAAKTPKAKKK